MTPSPHNLPSTLSEANGANTPPWQRRRLLQAGLAAGSAAWLAGCGSIIGQARPQVVVVGGGWGGLGAVRALAAQPGIDIALVEPNERFMSCPMSGHYVATVGKLEDLLHGYERVDALPGVKRIRDRVQAIERDRREVALASGQRLRYDYLVLSPGIEYMEESLPGFAAAREALPVGFRAFEHPAVRAQVERFLGQGGTFVMSAPKPPYRCPPAPYERAMLIAEQVKRRGVRGKIVFLDANAAPTPAPTAQPILGALKAYADIIDYRSNVELQAVDAGQRTLQTSEGALRFDHANLVLPMRAHPLIRQSGLGQRWAEVELPTFQAKADGRIFVIGDAQGSPQPKSGQVAFGQGRAVGEEIARRLRGEAAPATQGEIDLPLGICWAATSHDEAINVNVVTTFKPGEAPKLRFTVDPQPSARSGSAAWSWARGIWRTMLG
ncbi:MAG: FAD/NAD(P)-binding oxidoreductase [Tepidimonas sp.]|uniref:FAD-dependent oxidoreductase n=1 Tax=Tepidimonas sp. TaxID=2002775 RepID=UPI00259E83F0|nr:FAD/NAD(P)-binding oxidoreductase [Tepidimonas sp.]MDM7457576.1 FAD/NAD(P)-binding oxidoreductase [Tepidimonas sp.]